MTDVTMQQSKPRRAKPESVWLKELAFAARTLVRYPWTHGAAVLILAVALSAVLAISCLVDEMLWSPLPGITEPERVAWLFPTRRGQGIDDNRDAVSLPNVLYYGEHSSTLAGVAWFVGGNRVLLGNAEPEEIPGWAVSGDYFRVMGSAPVLGRLIGPEDAMPGAPPVVVLGNAFWRQRFGANPGVLGSTLDLDGTKHTVIGVLADRFFAQVGQPSLWLAHRPSAQERANRGLDVPAFARLKPGASFADVNRELDQLSLDIGAAHPETDHGLSVVARPIAAVILRFRPLAVALFSAALLVLAAAGANTANLLLAQTEERSRELAIRQALGARFWTIVRQWSLQVAALMALAVGAGTLGARWVFDAIGASMPANMKLSSLVPAEGLSWRPWLITASIALAATLFIGFVPARHAARIHLGRALRDGGGGAVGKAKGGFTRRLLVGLQVTLATALTFGATCAYAYFVAQRQIKLGFEPNGVTLLELPNHAATADDRAEFVQHLERRVIAPRERRSKTDSAHAPVLALGDHVPLARGYESQSFYREGAPRPEPDHMPWGKRVRVSPSFFDALGVELVAGRDFNDGDRGDAPCVVALGRKLASSLFGDTPAVGQRLHMEFADRAAITPGAPEPDTAAPTATEAATGAAARRPSGPCEVVGVVGDVYDVVPGGPGSLYVPAEQWPPASRDVLFVRGASDADLAKIRQEVRTLDPQQVIWQRSLDDVVASDLWGFHLLSTLFMLLASVGLGLSGIGIHAMLAHGVSLRRRELGLRAVLGAGARQLVWLIVSESVPIGAVGIATGIGCPALGMALIAGYHPHILAYTCSALLMATLLGASALASARRVTAIDPALALRRR